MSKRYRVLVFFIILAAELIAVVGQYRFLEFVVKPLIAIWLLSWFVLELRTTQHSLKKWIIFALFFSWLGDVLLMFHQDEQLFFLLGLSSFLVAHVFYIFFYHKIRVREKIDGRLPLLLIVAAYFTGIMALLLPYLGDMKVPVLIYAIVISCMLLLAMHVIYSAVRGAGIWMMTGAVLFVISDTLLAINKFYVPFYMAGFFVMLTYGLAQLFIMEGAIQYINSD